MVSISRGLYLHYWREFVTRALLLEAFAKPPNLVILSHAYAKASAGRLVEGSRNALAAF